MPSSPRLAGLISGIHLERPGRRLAVAVGVVVSLTALLTSAPAKADPSAQPSASTSHHAVPPPAPAPTAQGPSPDAPDPHPPVGGIGPDGEAVGGQALLSRGLVVPKGAPALPAGMTAQAWILVDLNSGNVLAGQDVHGRYQPASILKILTAATIMSALPGNQVVTASAQAVNTPCACMGLQTGGKYTVDNLFSGLLLVSGNDAAVALADAYGGVAKTVAAMNAEALKLGAYDTYVQTPNGLDGWKQLTSAYDMAIFLRAALNNPRFAKYDEQPSMTVPAQNVKGVGYYAPQSFQNQNNNFFDTVPGAMFAKTGWTDAAVHTAVFATDRGGRKLAVVMLRAQRWPQDQYVQAANLLNWGYKLPATVAPVGHLDPAPADFQLPTATVRRAAPVPVHHATGTSSSDLAVPETVIALLAVLAAAFGAAELTHRRRGAGVREPRQSRRSARLASTAPPAPAAAPIPTSDAATTSGLTGVGASSSSGS